MKHSTPILFFLFAFAIAGPAASAAQIPVADFQMDDATGTETDDLQNDASGGSSFDAALVNTKTVYDQSAGNGYLHVKYESSSVIPKTNLTTTGSTGTYTLTARFLAASLANSTNTAMIGFNIHDNANGNVAKILYGRNGNQIKLAFSASTDGSWDYAHSFGTNTVTDPVWARIVVDLDNDMAYFSWTYGTASGNDSVAITSGLTANRLRLLDRNLNTIGTNDYIDVDYVTVTIPEPAGAALLPVAAGIALLLDSRTRRRRPVPTSCNL